MTCRAVRKMFGRDMDGRLGPSESAALAGHLAGCAACRAERARWDELAWALRASGPTAVPSGLALRCWESATRAAPAPTLVAWFVDVARPAVFAGGLAALLVWALAAGSAARAPDPALTSPDPMELAVQLWSVEVDVDGR